MTPDGARAVPCPNGHKTEIAHYKESPHPTAYWVQCVESCNGCWSAGPTGKSEADAIRLWNMWRTPDPATQRVLEAAKARVESDKRGGYTVDAELKDAVEALK